MFSSEQKWEIMKGKKNKKKIKWQEQWPQHNKSAFIKVMILYLSAITF